MDIQTNTPFQHIALYGQSAAQDPDFSGPVPQDFTFNSPVGVCMDRQQHVWVCDTGNNRVVVFDKDLGRIVRVLNCPAPDSKGPGSRAFRMPFHVCPHPRKNQIFITDMGNSRVVVMEYEGDKIDFAFVFGDTSDNGGAPLQDPNGIALVRQEDGSYDIHVNDEFFHTESEKIRNRCVRYNENGSYIDEFRTVIDPEGTAHDLYWPQGLSADDRGNLYLANTGSYEVLKFAADAPVDANYCLQGKEPVVMHAFQQPSGLGMMNIMRDVSVIGDRVFVPDKKLNSISVYELDGKPLTTIQGIAPSWNHGSQPVRTASDPLYYALEDASLFSPYVICQGETPDIYFVSEPFCSRIVKLQIVGLNQVLPVVTMLTALGARRDQPGNARIAPQFNCVTAVSGLQRPRAPRDDGASPELELPDYLRFNLLHQWYADLGQNLTQQYQFWFGDWSRQMLKAVGAHEAVAAGSLVLDAGNWRIKAYKEQDSRFIPVETRVLEGLFLPGDLAMAVYHPKQALLGQICPGTPLVLISNFNSSTICLYQVGPNGKLLNYGLPFGYYGQEEGGLRGPQGMAVSDDGEVFIVDSLNNRMAKWQILQTGQVVFIKNFRWNPAVAEKNPAAFTPTDVALSADGRVLVTDQFNNRICVFDRSGKDLWCYGQEGYWEEGDPDGEKFMLPTSLAIDGEYLILNDLVNRALKLFHIESQTLTFLGGVSLFKLSVGQGGVWMPFFMHAHDGQVQIADSTYNIVQVFNYTPAKQARQQPAGASRASTQKPADPPDAPAVKAPPVRKPRTRSGEKAKQPD